MRRPLVLAAVAFVLGILPVLTTPGGLANALAVSALLLFAAAMLPRLRLRQALVVASIFTLVGAAHAAMQLHLNTPAPPDTEPYWKLPPTEGRVLEAPVPGADTEYAQLLVDSDLGRALVRWSDPNASVYAGQRITFQGDATTLLNVVNFGIGSPEDYYRTMGVTFAVSARANMVRVLDTPRFSPRYWVSRLRAWQSSVFDRAVPAAALPYVKAIWLGEREHISLQENQRYIDTGTAHILSISGLHVGMVFAVLEFLMLLRIRDPRPRAAIVLAVLCVYTLMAGLRVATVRSLLMIAIYLSARFVRREPDTPSALALSALLLLGWNPRFLLDAGFLLSFASVASLLLFADPLQNSMARMAKLPRVLTAILAPTLAVQILTLPLTVAFFHVAPLSSPLANLVAVPLTTAIMMGCIAVSTCALLLPPATVLFGHALWLPWFLMDWFIRRLAEVDALAWLLPSPTPWAVALFFAGALLPLTLLGNPLATRLMAQESSARHARRTRITFLASGGLLLLCVLLWKPSPPAGTMDLLDVGHGDAIALHPPEGGTVLVDAGDRTEFRDYGAYVVLPYLLAHGVTSVDALVITHADRDHIGGAFHVLDSIPVERVLLSATPSGRPLETGLLAKCRELGVEVQRLTQGDTLSIGGAILEVLHPPPAYDPTDSVNNASLVLHVSWPLDGSGNFSALLTGDIEASAEAALPPMDSPIQFLKVPHHGSRTSSSEEMLRAAKPAMGLVSTRQTARRKALGSGVAERYNDYGIPLWRTDTHGAIRVTGDPPYLISARALRGWR